MYNKRRQMYKMGHEKDKEREYSETFETKNGLFKEVVYVVTMIASSVVIAGILYTSSKGETIMPSGLESFIESVEEKLF